MKQLLQRKWFRILVRTTVVIASLLILAVAVFNWHAAGQKQRAIADAKTAGLALSASDLMTGMPPDELNFARHGIFALIEDGLALPVQYQTPAQKHAIASFDALGDEVLRDSLNRKRGNRADPADFSFLPDDNSYGKTAASFLAEYDRRHAAVLDEIRSGLLLPYVRRAALPKDFSGGDEWITLDDHYDTIILRVQRGLKIRIDAALETGDPAKAAESIEMICRLGELNGSRGFMLSTLMEFGTFRTIGDQVKRGMEQGRWTPETLDRISAAVSRQDVRARMIQGATTEAAITQIFEGWKDNRKRMDLHLDEGTTLLARIAPDGLFDRAAAIQLDQIRSVVSLLQNPAPAANWWKVAGELRSESKRSHELLQLLNGSSAYAAFLEIGSRTMAHHQLILAACAIERHRIVHGSYPESLAEIPAEITADPILGGTLQYERRGETFRLYTMGPPEMDHSKPDPRAKDWEW